jgi:hypothetical protein
MQNLTATNRIVQVRIAIIENAGIIMIIHTNITTITHIGITTNTRISITTTAVPVNTAVKVEDDNNISKKGKRQIV